VEVLDTLGSSVPKLSNSNGFGSAMAPRGNKTSILAFEVANTINKGAILFQSLSEENIQFLKKEILQSEGLQHLVSTDTKELVGLVEADKRCFACLEHGVSYCITCVYMFLLLIIFIYNFCEFVEKNSMLSPGKWLDLEICVRILSGIT